MKITGFAQTAIHINRTVFAGGNSFVYIACTNKQVKYGKRKSSIVYIGKTKKGASRVAISAVNQAEKLLEIPGINFLHFYIIKCKGVQSIDISKRLEDAFLHVFEQEFGQLPIGNKNRGDAVKWKKHFNRDHVVDLIEVYSSTTKNTFYS